MHYFGLSPLLSACLFHVRTHCAFARSTVEVRIGPRCKAHPVKRLLAECLLQGLKWSLCPRAPAPRFEALRIRQKITNILLVQIQKGPMLNMVHHSTILSAGQRHRERINHFSTIVVRQPLMTTIIHGNPTNRM